MTDTYTNRYQKKILTIPNLISLFRLCLIPLIVWLYISKEDYLSALLVLLLSGLTDIADGLIARKYNMISDFGKIFDPMADKLTQMAMLFCLGSRFGYMMLPLAILIIKEILTGITGLVSLKRTKAVKGAVWHGKLTTIVIYAMIVIHLIWFNIPPVLSIILIGVSIGFILMSFIMYLIQNVKAIKNRSFDN